MIDTDKIRANLLNGLMRHTSIDGGTHYPGCEHDHLECAILAMIDEIKRLQKQLRQYDQYTRSIDEVTHG